jgi:N-acetylmuramoyl-L-alanine amidase
MIENSKKPSIHKLTVVLVCCMITLFISTFLPTQVTYASSYIGINLDGDELEVPQSIIANVNGRVFVPIRIIAEELGAQVGWNNKQREITLSKGHKTVKLWIGSKQYTVNGTTNSMDAQPFIQKKRTLVPIRFVAGGLDVNVRWDAATSRVMLNELGLHTVMKNESLFFIGRALDTTAEELIRLNALTSDVITPGQVLIVPKQKYSQDTTASSASASVNTITDINTTSSETNHDSGDLYWLAKIIHTEARGEPLKGQVAVGAVVLNRVKNPSFPNDVYNVIFDKWGSYYQFEPVQNGEIYRLEPNATSYKAARRALAGKDPTNGALFFHNPTISKSDWMAAKPVAIRIGKHEFMY